MFRLYEAGLLHYNRLPALPIFSPPCAKFISVRVLNSIQYQGWVLNGIELLGGNMGVC